MALTASQEAVLERLNEQRAQKYEADKRDADAKGLRHPSAPTLLTAAQIAFPKYLYRDWKPSDKPDHYVAGQKRLVTNAEEEAVARKDGFSDSPERDRKK